MLNIERTLFFLSLLALTVALIAAPTPARAFDCTPIATTPCGIAYYGLLNTGAVPGEPACGFDYTGWNFHVFEFTLTSPSQTVIEMFGPGMPVDGDLLLFDGCLGSDCIASDTNPNDGQNIMVCLDVGTYYFVIASQSTATTVFATGVSSCLPCDPVPTSSWDWGSLKSMFR